MPTEQPINILLVDDHAENLLALEALLEPLGQNLIKTNSGPEALKQVLRQDFAVILLDVQMPGMDGFETAELIRGRERSRHTPIIFLTAINTSELHVSRGYQLGAVDYLLKPIVADVLLAKVGAFVELSRKTAQIERQAAELRQARDELEQRVEERTANLAETNQSLRAEIAERERAEQSLRFLAEASRLLAESLDYEDRLAKIARLAIPILGDWCAIDVLEEHATPRRVAIAARDPAKEELERAIQDRYAFKPDAPYGTPHVLRTGASDLRSEIADELLVASALDDQHLAMLRARGLRSFMCVPLTARDKLLGTIVFATYESARAYAQADQRLAEDLARRVAVAIDNARLYQSAQDSIRIRDIFLSVAAHELRTPLTALLGYAQLVERRASRENSIPERDRQGLQMVSAQAFRLNQMVNSLLDISRIQLGQLSIEAMPLDLDTLAARLVEESRPLLTQHTIEYQGPEQPAQIYGDELRLEQVIHNLIQNAVKYSPAGGTIKVQVERDGEEAYVAVTDPGIGIPAEALPRLFSRFYRAPNVDPQHISGLGVGLYVVKEITELHGGRIEVQSEEGKGSTFTLRMPLLEEAQSLATPEANGMSVS